MNIGSQYGGVIVDRESIQLANYTRVPSTCKEDDFDLKCGFDDKNHNPKAYGDYKTVNNMGLNIGEVVDTDTARRLNNKNGEGSSSSSREFETDPDDYSNTITCERLDQRVIPFKKPNNNNNDDEDDNNNNNDDDDNNNKSDADADDDDDDDNRETERNPFIEGPNPKFTKTIDDGQIMASGAFRWKAKSNRYKTSQQITSTIEIWGLLAILLHVAVYIYYIVAVLFQMPWKRGLYGYNLPHESAYISDHFGIIWCLNVFTMTHIFVPAILVWILADLNDLYRRKWGKIILICQIIMMIILFICLGILTIFWCNTGVSRNLSCDDSDFETYCTRWADSNPAGCPREVTQDITLQLKSNNLQYRWFIVLVVFVILDCITALSIREIEDYAYCGYIVWNHGRYVEDQDRLHILG